MNLNIWLNRYLIIKDRIKRKRNKIFYFKKLETIKVKDTDETLNKLLSGNYSIIRLGDGELNLIFGERLKFQRYDIKLAQELKEILYCNEKNLLIGLPNIFNNLTIYTPKAKKFWEEYLERKIDKILSVIDLKKTYYDTQISRFYIDINDKNLVAKRVEKLKKLWAERDILLIEGEKSRLGVGNDLFNNTNSITRIICPSHEAYSLIDKIEKRALKEAKNKLILLALGPTATVLGYRLYKKGYQVMDIGHIDIEYEWFLKKANKKEAVKNKYIGEVSTLDSVIDIKDTKYLEQIVAKILN